MPFLLTWQGIFKELNYSLKSYLGCFGLQIRHKIETNQSKNRRNQSKNEKNQFNCEIISQK